MRKRIGMAFGAALVGAAAVAASGGTAEAAAKRAAPQSLSFLAGRSTVKDNLAGRSGLNLGQFASNGFIINLNVAATSVKVSRTGSGSTKSLLLVVIGAPDVRTADLPVTIAVADKSLPGTQPTVTGAYNEVTAKYVGRFPTGSIQQTTKSWVVDESAAGSFSVTFKSYNAASNRVAVTFQGTLAPGDNNPGLPNLPIKKGKGNLNCVFNGF